MTTIKSNPVPQVGIGVVIGMLLSGGAFLGLKSHLIPPPIVQTVTVEKTVIKRVEVPVTITNTEKRLFRAQLVDKTGHVTREWTVVKCKFRVIGATLTDKEGNVFPVVGNIRIAPLSKQALIPSDNTPVVENTVDNAVFASEIK